MVVAAVALAACGTAGQPATTAGDRGSFSVACEYSHSANDDPIVHAGHRGTSHRHDFFGATTTNAGSTAASLMAGGTTCRSVADRSAYWAPALEAGGRAVTPTHVQAYYRTPVGTDARLVRPLPNGLEMIAGDAEATDAQDPAVVRWSCGVAGDASPVPRRCAGPGAELRLRLVFPQCWDGEHLRSADHLGHLARLPEAEGERGCPASHPVLLPETTVEVRYPTDLPPGDLTLASGPATGGHGDLLVAWDQDHLAGEVDTCLHRNLRCDVTSEPERLDTAPER
jgi:Domain of unknown function (DUF1996)